MPDKPQLSNVLFPSVFNPQLQQTLSQQQMAHDLNKLARQSTQQGLQLPDNSKLMNSLMSEINQNIQLNARQIVSSIDSLSRTTAWNLGLMHDTLTRQTELIEQVVGLLKSPTENKAREFYHNGQQMAEHWLKSVETGVLTPSEAERLYDGIKARYQKAVSFLPSQGLTYSIMIAQAELHLLAQEYDKAGEYFETSISYAPETTQFNYLSYPCRVLGRMAFARGDIAGAIQCLKRAVAASSQYPIAWYEFAQYLAQDGQTEQALVALKNSIILKQEFWYVVAEDSLFDVIRNEVDDFLKTFFENKKIAPQKYIEYLDKLLEQFLVKSRTKEYDIAYKIATIYKSHVIGGNPLFYPGIYNVWTDWYKTSKDLRAQYNQCSDLLELGRLIPQLLQKTKEGPQHLDSLDKMLNGFVEHSLNEVRRYESSINSSREFAAHQRQLGWEVSADTEERNAIDQLTRQQLISLLAQLGVKPIATPITESEPLPHHIPYVIGFIAICFLFVILCAILSHFF